MLQKPTLSVQIIRERIDQIYGLRVDIAHELQLGYDATASVYKLETPNQDYFLKVRSSEINHNSLLIPKLLQENGIQNVIAPIQTQSGQLSSKLEGYKAVLYPFISGDSAMNLGLSQEQWGKYGRTLRQIQSPEIAQQVAGLVPRERFDIPSLELVWQIDQIIEHLEFDLPSQLKLVQFWLENRELIRHIGERARILGQKLQAQNFDSVLCHSDIHAANIMVSGERFYLVDWDSPLLAPPERDLLFVVGSMIARRVSSQEEAWFFEGYGPHRVNLHALAYFRYERAIQDIGEDAYSILLQPGRTESDQLNALRIMMGLFEPNDIIQAALTLDPGA